MIQSFIPGRVRLRSPLFFKPEIVQLLLETLQLLPFETSAEVNDRQGSVLIKYPAGALPLSKLLSLKNDFAPLGPEFITLEQEEDTAIQIAGFKTLRDKALKLLG